MIIAENIRKQFGKKEVLHNISFKLDSNKIYGLLGRNGAGKTTLLSLLASYNEPTSGRMMLDGEDVFENEALMQKVLFIKEEIFEYEGQKVEAYLRDRGEFRSNYDHSYALDLAKKFHLPLDARIDQLSRGMQSALCVVHGLSARAPITIFDEAYLGMDAPARELFYREVLADYMEHPRTIILSTHLISEMDSLFEEVLIIKDGSLLLHERTEELLAKGASITGKREDVDRFITGKKVLKTQELGTTKMAILYGSLLDSEIDQAQQYGLEVGPIRLQELFIHLTEKGEDKYE